MYENGIGDWRVYSAEQAVGTDEPVDLDSAQQLTMSPSGVTPPKLVPGHETASSR